MKKSIFIFVIGVSLLSTIFFIACNKEKGGSTTTLKVRLTDAPFNAEEVNVDIQQVKAKFSQDSTQGWIDLQTNARVYNLLGLQNGVDTLLATGTVPTEVIQEIRFVLGSNNTIKIAGVTYPLSIPSGSESGLKIKVGKQLRTSIDSLLVDFDASLSIHQTGTGAYQLKPVLKLK